MEPRDPASAGFRVFAIPLGAGGRREELQGYNVCESEVFVKALYFEEHGGTEKLIYGDRPEPEPGPGEVRVRLKTAALYHLDLFVLGGIPGIPMGLRHIGGADGAGVVVAVGGGVDSVDVGA